MKKKKDGFVVVIDSREQLPFQFPDNPTIVKKLDAGDYSIENYEDKIAVERKSKNDLFGTIGKGRERFTRELERLSTFDFACIVCEADFYEIFKKPPSRSKVSPKSVFGSLLAWSMRYNVHALMYPGRDFAEKATFKILERYYVDNILNKK